MGSAKSVPATPVRPPPVNKHLAHVSDPRSPSAGILRTPIQVESSPQRSPPAPVEAGETAGADQPRAADPRSPTPGISRTPMKTGAVEPTVLLGKQLGAELEAEAPEFSSTPKRAASSASGVAPEGPSPLAPGLGSGAESPPAPPLHRLSPAEGDGPPAPAGPAQASDKLPRGPETPRCAGARGPLRKASAKALGRSPLTILHDDNSPSPLPSRQGKRPAGPGENAGERPERVGPGAGRPVNGAAKVAAKSAAAGCGRERRLDKENRQHRPLVDN
ncbi:cell division cycle-associated protein 3 isoform X2 [Ornithorhynchus anatinus]|uniref:Cell division cycle associated 3 n=1 Tax=Ornithorhynchus anatinus TaxID=9258 RepID=A0A6I8P6R0_ORNAN|nr:cell division cycle-associated protein 3 isoform X2 [Ornithorhynchus anatinus]